MSKQEQAVLDFFSQEENLTLALAVADQTDEIRQRMNNAFWLALQDRISTLVQTLELPWQVAVTEDRNAAEALVGLHLQPVAEQTLFLRPMLEQQLLGNTLRIYYGLAWSTAPTPEHTRLAEVAALHEAFQSAGYKTSTDFLAWQWTPYYPRRRDFLLRFSTEEDKLLDEVTGLLQGLLQTHGTALQLANNTLRSAPRSATVSLNKLRANLPH
ncbi:MAG: hypothetical protein V4443_04925 [Pseudomonadota bacterium]